MGSGKREQEDKKILTDFNHNHGSWVNMNNKKIILASESPRRKYLLEQAGIDFEVMPSKIDESNFIHTESKKSADFKGPADYVKKLSMAKARDIADKHIKAWVIGADTIVVIDGRILEKPESKDHAAMMLKSLSNRIHLVYTGFSLCCSNEKRMITRSVKTEVLFKKLSDYEIEWYVNTDEPFDKAGAYAIQGIGTFLVKSINGSYTNVVGLPVCEVIEILIKEGVISRKKTGSENDL